MAELHVAYPTDAKEREKTNTHKAEKEQGIERVIQKRKKVMKDHHDDCGDGLASLNGRETAEALFPCDFDTDDQLSDEDHDNCLKRQMGQFANANPVGMSKVAPAQKGSIPAPGPYPRAPKQSMSAYQGCMSYRARNDWEHIREFGQCMYPI